MSKIKHSGFMSSIKHDNLTPWYVTQGEDEVIEFYENGGTRNVNALTIEAGNSDLYIRMLPSDYCLYIPANEGRTFDFQRVNKIQIMGVAGQEIRWSGQFY